MKIEARKEWGAHSATGMISRTTWGHRVGVLFHHTTGGTGQTPRDIQRVHQEGRGWFDVGYNFLIDVHGNIYEGRGWTAVGAHCEGHNTPWLGVAFIGDFRSGHNTLTPKAKAAGAWLYAEACRRARKVLAYRGHQEMSGAATECPGHQVMQWIEVRGPAIRSGSSTSTPGKHADTTWTERIVKDLPVLGKGDDGKAVTRMQGLLNIAGGPNLDLDGDYGPKTETRVEAFQGAEGLTVDGICGPKTWAALLGVS